jgi:xylulokinase
MSYLLGIDIGTGGTRAVLVDASGKLVASATQEHQAFASPQIGWAEQHPHDWWQACCAAVRRLISENGVAPEGIACIGLTGQMHGAVLLDDKDQVIRPSLIWCDQRSDAEAQQLTDQIGEQRLIEWTCNPALTNFTATKLLWVKNHEPDLWKRFRRLLLPKDYVRLRLTGEHAMDVAEASGTLLLDVRNRRWSEPMLDALQLSAGSLPRLAESQEVVGVVSSAGADATGLRAGTPVVAGAGDQAAGAVGLGIVQPGAVSVIIGTSGVVFAATDRPALDQKGRLHTFCHAAPNRWHVMGVTQAAGLSLRWMRDRLEFRDGDVDPYDLMTQEASQAPPGSEGVLWAPYLMGERTPHLDPHARGALIGLTASHTRAHIIRAVLEGVAFSLNDTFAIFAEMGVPVRQIRLGGGGARSPLWRQIQADIYAHSVEIVEAEEGAAFGAAILAGVGAGVWPSVDEACVKVVRVRTTVEPVSENVPVMKDQYLRFRRIYPALKSIEQGQRASVNNKEM